MLSYLSVGIEFDTSMSNINNAAYRMRLPDMNEHISVQVSFIVRAHDTRLEYETPVAGMRWAYK